MRALESKLAQVGLQVLAAALAGLATGCAGALSSGDAPDLGNQTNQAPVILGDTITTNVANPQTGNTLKLSVNATDPEGQNLTYAWGDGNTVNGEFTGTGSSVFWSSEAAGDFVFTCLVTDTEGATARATVQLTVAQGPATGPNTPPTIDPAGVTADVSEPVAGQSIVFKVSASDAEGDPLLFIWSDNTGQNNFSNESVSGGVASVTWQYDETGNYTINVVVNDGKTSAKLVSEAVTASTTVTLAEMPSSFDWVGGAHCAICHPDKNDEWETTLHSQAVKTLEDIGRDRTESCKGCHTVGFRAGGFIDAELTPQFASVQCESCHGTGVGHPANGPRPIPWNPKTGYKMDANGVLATDASGNYIWDPDYDGSQGYGCGKCHTGNRHGAFPEWAKSDHALQENAPQTEVEDGVTVVGPPGEASCMKCHNGQGFVSIQIKGEEPPAEDLTPEQMTDDMHIGCATCHDPHKAQFDSQLRVASTGTVTIPFDETGGEGTALAGGKANTCLMCHNGRRTLADRTKQIEGASNPRGFHGNSQGPALFGLGGIEFPGVHYDREHPHNTWNENKCVTCHMFSKEYDPETQSPKVWGHDWVPAWEACASCHPNITDQSSFDEFKGNWQAGTQALLDEFVAAWPAAWKDLSDPEEPRLIGRESEPGAGDGPPVDDPDYGNQYRMALWNYNYVTSEASRGIHNPTYERQLLQSAIDKLAELNAQ